MVYVYQPRDAIQVFIRVLKLGLVDIHWNGL